jgi:dTDP-4-amino-4,6-dideoxygalactose transaminase
MDPMSLPTISLALIFLEVVIKFALSAAIYHAQSPCRNNIQRHFVNSHTCGTLEHDLKFDRISVNTIPPFDLSEQFTQIGEELNQAALSVLASGRYIGGTTVETFEQAFAQYHGVSECVACNSGTDALYLALRALDIQAGDEVITTPFTFFATAETISATGATPIFVDIDDSLNIDVNKIAAAITPRTKAIMPVHLFGRSAHMGEMMTIAQQHNLAVIEDCAQATGTEWQGQKVGSIGQIGCFSFYPTKNLGACGDGGAMTTNDPKIAARLRVLRDHGRSALYCHTELGMNSRLDAIQAAILTVKLPYLDKWIEQRQRIADRYNTLLQSVPGISLPSSVSNGKLTWNQYTLRVLAGKRDMVRDRLKEKGISTMVYYPIPMHLQPVYQNLNNQTGALINSETAAQTVLSLPMFPELSVEQQDYVVDTLKGIMQS